MSKIIEIKPFRSFDISKLSLGPIRTTKTGAQYFKIKYPNDEDWYLQTPICKTMFKPEFSLSLCVILDFEEFLSSLDRFIVENITKRSTYTFPEISELYSPFVRIYQEDSDTINIENKGSRPSKLLENLTHNAFRDDSDEEPDKKDEKPEAIVPNKYDKEIYEHLRYKHSLEFIRLNVGQSTHFFDKNGLDLESHLAMDGLKVGDEVRCIIHFKQAQIKKPRNSDEFVASIQLSLIQVQIVNRAF
jgi:hypothetical protein